MREDKYGPMLLELFNSTQVPLTSSEAAEAVGCSKQRAYAWIDANRGLLVSKGRQKYGGIGYVGKQNPVNGKRANVTGDPAVIEVGVQFEVVGIAVAGGKIVVSMVDELGGTARFLVADEA